MKEQTELKRCSSIRSDCVTSSTKHNGELSCRIASRLEIRATLLKTTCLVSSSQTILCRDPAPPLSTLLPPQHSKRALPVLSRSASWHSNPAQAALSLLMI